MEKTIINCQNPACRMQLRVPLDIGLLKITCPHCKTVFQWEPESIHELDFRCAKSGKPFKVLFSRETTNNKFRITQIARTSSSYQSPTLSKTSVTKSVPQKQQSINSSDLDFAGWYCPHCGYKGSPIFVRCGTCHEMVCGTTIIRIGGFVTTYRCHDGCGASGLVDGSISDYESKPVSLKGSQKHAPPNKNQLDSSRNNNPALGNG